MHHGGGPPITEEGMTTKKITPANVAELLSFQIEAINKTQAEIATEVGFERPNVITMIKQGKTKLPIAKIGPMARALGLDPVFLFGFVMREYHPETWDAIESMYSQPVMTANEMAIIRALRASGKLPKTAIPPSDEGKIVRAIEDAIAAA